MSEVRRRARQSEQCRRESSSTRGAAGLVRVSDWAHIHNE